jgi:hypothetical protein
MEPNQEMVERLEAGRVEVRRAVAGDNVIQIHPFDMFFLLTNPTVMDIVLINLFDRQFVVVDGGVYEQTSQVQNKRKLSEVMNFKYVEPVNE